MTEIRQATPEEAVSAVPLVMEAMDLDCCRNFAGPRHTLGDFRRMMEALVVMDDSQYSYRNMLVAVSGGDIAGCLIGYDGGDLLRLRRRFIEKAKEYLDQDFSNMDEETQAGEYYLDSLCVKGSFRRQGIATCLIREAIARHGSQPIGLLVDYTHPWAERLYLHIGFKYVGESSWGGHAMKHLQYAQ